LAVTETEAETETESAPEPALKRAKRAHLPRRSVRGALVGAR
jgi:hypothetical protein